MSFQPLLNPIGFGATDFIELALTAMLVCLALGWPLIQPLALRFASRTALCMIVLALAPVGLRLALLPTHPAPTPDLYDEFGHLLMADTLGHFRLANSPHPMSRFFETFFVLQSPSYSSIYPVGNGLTLALGRSLFGTPWAGLLLCNAAFSALCYWMLLGWTTAPGWSLLGGVLAVFEFGPLNQWTNSYWGGGFSALAGCLVFGALPRRNMTLLGLGLALYVLTRPYESIFLFVAVTGYFLWIDRPRISRRILPGALILIAAFGITLLQNKRVTGYWTELPYQLSQYQYGVPAALTFQNALAPHRALTPQQDLDYRMQSNFHPGKDTITSYAQRVLFRVRYYRFYFYPPLYLAALAFLLTLGARRWIFAAATCLLFALGINFFPAFQFHYLAAVVCLFVLISVVGLERIASLPHGSEVARAIVFLCVAQFAFWYSLHALEPLGLPAETRAYDVWNSINHTNPERRIAVARLLASEPGKLLVFVRYWPQHIFQDEWVYNGAAIDEQRIVWARDLGETEDRKLVEYYKDRKPLLLEPDARPPALNSWEPAPEESPAPADQPPKPEDKKPPHPLIELEQVR